MSQPSNPLRALLGEAMRDRRKMRLHVGTEQDPVIGYAVAANDKWLLMIVESDGHEESELHRIEDLIGIAILGPESPGSPESPLGGEEPSNPGASPAALLEDAKIKAQGVNLFIKPEMYYGFIREVSDDAVILSEVDFLSRLQGSMLIRTSAICKIFSGGLLGLTESAFRQTRDRAAGMPRTEWRLPLEISTYEESPLFVYEVLH